MKNFNKIKSITFCVLFSVIFTACEKDYFDTQPDNQLSVDGIFSNRGQTEKWWAGLFSNIPDIWDQPYNYQYGITSDEIDASNWINPGINSGAITPDGTPSNFTALYERIRLATIFLERIDDNQEILEQENGDEIIKHYKGEARFLRAYYYWRMMKQLGPVVIAPLESALPGDDFQIPRTTWDDSVAFVLSEIEKAKLDLPVDYYLDGSAVDGTQIGRINKIIATALESQILLYHASPLFNGNSELADFKNLDGTILFNQSYDASRWERAAQKAKEAIDIAESNGKSLFSVEDEDPFRAGFLSSRNLYWDGWRTEGIWIRPSSNVWSWEIHASPRSTAGTAYNGIAVVQRLVDEYRMADGTDIEDSETYSEDAYTDTATPYYAAGTNVMYTNREPRFYAHITFNGADNPGAEKSGVNNSRVEFFLNGTSGKSGSPRDWPKTGYTARKNIHPTFSLNPAVNVARPAMLIRLAELYLNYAEALNESNPGDPNILFYLNKIKTRAGLPAIASGLNQMEMRQEIRHERRIELSFEGHRYFDVRRWKIADQPGSNQGGAFYGMNMNGGTSLSDPAFHERTIGFTRAAWQRKFYFMPYGQNEMDRNKKLVQFPGY